jgi:hypothetical protein
MSKVEYFMRRKAGECRSHAELADMAAAWFYLYEVLEDLTVYPWVCKLAAEIDLTEGKR